MVQLASILQKWLNRCCEMTIQVDQRSQYLSKTLYLPCSRGRANFLSVWPPSAFLFPYPSAFLLPQAGYAAQPTAIFWLQLSEPVFLRVGTSKVWLPSLEQPRPNRLLYSSILRFFASLAYKFFMQNVGISSGLKALKDSPLSLCFLLTSTCDSSGAFSLEKPSLGFFLEWLIPAFILCSLISSSSKVLLKGSPSQSKAMSVGSQSAKASLKRLSFSLKCFQRCPFSLASSCWYYKRMIVFYLSCCSQGQAASTSGLMFSPLNYYRAGFCLLVAFFSVAEMDFSLSANLIEFS